MYFAKQIFEAASTLSRQPYGRNFARVQRGLQQNSPGSHAVMATKSYILTTTLRSASISDNDANSEMFRRSILSLQLLGGTGRKSQRALLTMARVPAKMRNEQLQNTDPDRYRHSSVISLST